MTNTACCYVNHSVPFQTRLRFVWFKILFYAMSFVMNFLNFPQAILIQPYF